MLDQQMKNAHVTPPSMALERFGEATTVRKSCRYLAASLLSALLAMLAPGCIAPTDTESDGEPIDEVSEPLISTWYYSNASNRAVYARGPFMGTPRLRLTWKTFGTGSCNWKEVGLVPVPSNQITVSICGNVGLQYKLLSGGVSACVTSSNSVSSTPVYYYSWWDALATQMNYRAFDQGLNGAVLNDSGWVPFAGNGCPR